LKTSHGRYRVPDVARLDRAFRSRAAKQRVITDVTSSSSIPGRISREMLLTLYRNMLTQRAVDTRGLPICRTPSAPRLVNETTDAVKASRLPDARTPCPRVRRLHDPWA
jgi:hypothetical protein